MGGHRLLAPLRRRAPASGGADAPPRDGERTPAGPPADALARTWAGLALLASALLAFAPPSFLAAASRALPGCLWKGLTGVPCPGCGSGRAALALASGQMAEAFRLNPLFAASLLVFVAAGLVAGALSLSGRPLREPRRLPRWLFLLLVLAVAANWGWLLSDGR